ncbi:unnamed protein product [Caenorhabditis sp. 36 PRJEB53466]|nr:unnamed protein product [Caenorhabditis sp. 36 PRJEB53466]
MMSKTTLILDNGGHNIKIGNIDDDAPRLIPNSIVKSKHERRRVFVAQEQEECLDKFSLFYVRPIERGYVVNWDTQQQIWDKVFGALEVETSTSRIVYADNNYLIPALPDVSNEIFFEHFDFTEVCKGSASTFIAEHSHQVLREKCVCVVDTGFSWTTISCFVDGLLIQDSVVRIDVGGKALTNKLKDWISYRTLDVSSETYVINEVKEDLCYVTMDFESSMKEAKKRFDENTIVKKYIMPDFHNTFRGVVKDARDPSDPSTPSITLGIERFATPEILFNPSDIDIDQCGVAEGVIESLARSPETLRAALSQNIVVVGGSSCFTGFRERLLKDIRSMLPAEFSLKISDAVENAQTHAWQCARQLLSTPNVRIPWVNRKEWNERGDSLEYSKFFKTVISSDELKESRALEEQKEKTPKDEEEEEAS